MSLNYYGSGYHSSKYYGSSFYAISIVEESGGYYDSSYYGTNYHSSGYYRIVTETPVEDTLGYYLSNYHGSYYYGSNYYGPDRDVIIITPSSSGGPPMGRKLGIKQGKKDDQDIADLISLVLATGIFR